MKLSLLSARRTCLFACPSRSGTSGVELRLTDSETAFLSLLPRSALTHLGEQLTVSSSAWPLHKSSRLLVTSLLASSR